MDINRGIVVVKPREPYVNWANSCDEFPTKTTLDDLHRECTAYLLPEWYDDDELERLIQKHSRFIFENELAGWSTDESTWPRRRGYKTFREWFTIEHHSVVLELGDGIIEVEEL
jgi:hypothetical protein